MSIKAISPNTQKAIFLAKSQLSNLVYDAVNLEGIQLTLPDIQSLLNGASIESCKKNDQQIALNQANAWLSVFEKIILGNFSLNKQFVCALHAIAGENEALEWGVFRRGGVTIAGTDYLPPSADTLDERWHALIAAQAMITDICPRAIYVFLQMARNQFFMTSINAWADL